MQNRKRLNLKGKKFGRLTVVEFSHTHARYGKSYWLVVCECGNKSIVCGSDLQRGKPESCGCLRIEQIGKFNNKSKSIHGMAKSRFWRLWLGMRHRCGRDKDYLNVVVSDEWQDFVNFKNDMYEKYQQHVNEFGEKNTTLDRIDSLKGYSKDNCRWVTQLEQARNRKGLNPIEIDGEKKLISEWSEKYGISKSTVYRRIRYGMSVESAIKTPLLKRRAYAKN